MFATGVLAATALVLLEAGTGRVLRQEGDVNTQAAPGSVIKPFVLRAWSAGQAPEFLCNRRLLLAGRRMDCSHLVTARPLNAAEALAYSCNGYFAELGRRANPQRLAETLRSFGFAVRRDASTAEEAQLMALGEFGVAISPLDLARAYARIVPVDGLREAVEAGTAQRAAVEGLTVAGKTGTTRESSWFAGYADNVVVVVRTRGGTGGSAAAPLAAEALKRLRFAGESAGVAPAAASTAAHRIRLRGGRTIAVEDYVAAAVAGEVGAFSKEPEFLKAMAVVARTFAAANPGRHARDGYDLCEYPHCQRMLPAGVTARIRELVEATEAELLWWEGRPAQVFYTGHCGGRSEAAVTWWPGLKVPYLRSQPDTFCLAQGRRGWSAELNARELEIVTRAPSGRVKQLRLHGVLASFDAVRQWSRDALKSAWFEIRPAGAGRFHVEGFGTGHGVGLCQVGAAERAAQGHTYRQILSAYFPGTKAGVSAQGIAWQTLCGERVELWSTAPDRDRTVLESAERALGEAERCVGRRLRYSPQLRVFPSVAMFRDATEQPGTVAAVTSGRMVRTQPNPAPAVLLHEMLHLVTEDGAAGGPARLPHWFLEGLVLHLAREAPPVGSDYARFLAHLRKLIAAHGEPAVLAWLDSGIPQGLAELPC
ncbi:MAG: hypothetical protein FJW31_26415 [Acidobacteria bacterium]|nr:hypothetical protein [Acidobacteriota bacterium]